MTEIPSIGEVVRRWRELRKLTVTEFAKRAGLTKGYVSELENNKIDNPKPPQLEKLAAALGVSAWDLISRRMPDVVPQTDPTDGMLRRRRSSLAAPRLSPKPGTVEPKTVGQQLDTLIEEEALTSEELKTLMEVLLPHTRQLVQLIKSRQPNEET